ncbi:COG1361 S-layer family protein [Candidatus Methanoperedens nitratireducens]|uniref:Uncharacterized protein n=1 Tax=Candidatus Methanoperedens nitratireducens TaxID=1392998 RepID=A0A284VIQ0_9EURY|nr:hypothetical protein [Candidatus Methanoperedens nitroreducens]SNQ59121.1 conserved exported hypothetical protein [Candidatus Methanoperedens nitroreducens]
MRDIRKTIAIFIVAMFSAVPVYASTTYLPQSFDFSNNYYTVFGEPNLTATLIGSNEFEKGEQVILSINVLNSGKILGFRTERELDPSDPDYSNRKQLAEKEKNYELQKIDALNVIAVLSVDSGEPLQIKSGPQYIGSIRGGVISSPIQFAIEIDKDAAPGIYKLKLNLSYDFQQDVQVSGNVTRGEDVTNFWYDKLNQNQTIEIKIKKQAEFEVINVTSRDLRVNSEGLVEITYKNTGEEIAKEAVARINVIEPLSSIDDQAFLGTLAPGQKATAVFKIKVDKNAILKPYEISNKIKYSDTRGNTKISDEIITSVVVEPALSLGDKLNENSSMLLISGFLAVVVGTRHYLKKKSFKNSTSLK